MERVKCLLLSNFDSQVNAGKVIDVGKKLFLLISVLTCSSLPLGSGLVCSIDKVVHKDIAKDLQKIRSQNHSICLECSGDSCTMKLWSSEKADDAEVCKLLFCRPSHVPRGIKFPEGLKTGNSLINFDYYISAQGRIKGVEITSVKGAMNGRQAYKYVTSFTKKTTFEPLIIEGRTYQILGLSGQILARIGSSEDINRYREANPGVWRN